MKKINPKYLLNLSECTAREKGTNSTIHYNLKNILLNMPREKNHVDVMRQHRIKLKEKGKKYLPGILNLQVRLN